MDSSIHIIIMLADVGPGIQSQFPSRRTVHEGTRNDINRANN